MNGIQNWVVLGFGGQGRQVAATIQAARGPLGESILGFIDDEPAYAGASAGALKVLGTPDEWLRAHEGALNMVVALGNPVVRAEVMARVRALRPDIQFPTVVHPFTSIGPRVELGQGVVVHPGTVMLCDLVVGDYSIVGASCSLSHDSRVGKYCSLSPGTRLAGASVLGDFCWTGMNSTVIPYKTVGHHCVLGAGCVVVNDIEDGLTVAGVPAKALRAKA